MTFSSAGLSAVDSAFSSSQAPYSSLSPELKAILAGGLYWTNTPGSITISHHYLIPLVSYQIQFWVNDSTGSASTETRTEYLTDAHGHASGILAFNVEHAGGGVGQSIIGQFVATGSDVTITLHAQNGTVAQLNALSLRGGAALSASPPIPEPATVSLFMALAAGAVLLLRRR